MNISLLSCEDRKRAYKLEQLDEIGKVIHFSNDFVEDGTFLLRKKCYHRENNHKLDDKEYTHEFGIYHSEFDGLIYFHRCDNCMNAIRISEEYYRRAKQIYDNGGKSID